MSDQFKLETIGDFAALTPEQFGRMLPDFIAWHQFAQYAKSVNAEVVGFTWVDDGLAGEMHIIRIHETDTGNKYSIKGPAHTQPQGGEA